MNNKIFRSISYGLYIISTMDGQRKTGCIANSIMQITSDPATIALSMNHDNYTNSCIAKTGKFAFSILSEASDTTLIGNFGFQSGRDVDKFQAVDHEMIGGIPVVKGTCGYVVCEVIDQMETATHTVFLGKVIEADVYQNAGNPMTYAYYHNVVKGKSPKNAPTYIKEEDQPAETVKNRYACQVCGYIYEGDSLPEDFKCPVCGAGAERFKKVE